MHKDSTDTAQLLLLLSSLMHAAPADAAGANALSTLGPVFDLR